MGEEKTDLEILLETITEHATELENQIHTKNKKLTSYVLEVEKVTAAAAAVENDCFQPESLNQVADRSDELGQLARVFQQMAEQVKAREDALRIAKENYYSIFENALEGIFQSTPDGHYINVNPAMARIYGFDSPSQMMADVKAIRNQMYLDADRRVQFQQLIAQSGQVQGFEYQSRRYDGTVIWIEEHTRAVTDANGEVLYYEGIIQDITRQKQEAEDLKRQLQELQIEIDQQKRQRDVAEITQSDYFQELQAVAEDWRFEDD
ncbi:MAG: PAS domain S-box protein [Cyanothece sp. SIO1E1]|nr:PAS domain S-box protein [Cyanothece sp. SIO1E1]